MTKQTAQEKAARKRMRAAKRAKEEVAAMNNVRTTSAVKSSGSSSVGMSKRNRSWREKRYKRYNDKVWPGWRESDGKKYPVVSFKASDLKDEA